MTTLTNDMEYTYYYKILQSLDDNDIDMAKTLLFDIYDIDNTIFDDYRRFTNLFSMAFQRKDLYFMRLLLNLGLDVNSYIYLRYNITIFNHLIEGILDSYANEYSYRVEDDFIVEAFKLIFENSKIDYDRGDKNYYDLLYSDNGFGYMDKQRLINLLENAKTNTNTYMAKQRSTLAKIMESQQGPASNIRYNPNLFEIISKHLKTKSFDPNISFYRNNPYEKYDEYLKRKSMLENKKYMQKHSNRKFAKRTKKKRKPKRF